jgi:hypothetical protein
MATGSINPGVVHHVLPKYFQGYTISVFCHASNQNYALQKLAYDLKPEVIRTEAGTDNTTVADDFKALMLALQTGNLNTQGQFAPLDFAIVAGLHMGPISIPSSFRPTQISGPNDIAGTGTAASPVDAMTVYTDWVNSGLKVLWIQPYNEPTNQYLICGNVDSDLRRPWYCYTTGQDSRTAWGQADDWASVHHRYFYTQVQSTYSSLAASHSGLVKPKVCLGVCSTGQADELTVMRAAITGGMMNIQGYTWPQPDNNINYFETADWHPYTSGDGGTSQQSHLNSLVFNPSTEGNFNTSAIWSATKIRATLDANGGSAKTTGWSEAAYWQNTASPQGGPLAHAIYAVICANNQAAWKLDFITINSLCQDVAGKNFLNGPGGVPDNGTPTSPSTPTGWTPNARYYSWRDLCAPYLNAYKKQLNPTVTGSGSTPATTDNNSVPRIQMSAGLNNAGDKLGILVCNMDLTTAENVVINLGLTAAGPITGKKLTNPQPAQTSIGAPLPSITAFGSGLSSFTVGPNPTSGAPTMGAGEALFLEVPITTTVTSPPTNVTLPTITGTPQVGQTLTADPGSWTNSPSSFSYQWLRSQPASQFGVPTLLATSYGQIVGATSSTYVLQAADIGQTIEVSVVATNGLGSGQALSAATPVVQAGVQKGSSFRDTFSATLANYTITQTGGATIGIANNQLVITLPLTTPSNAFIQTINTFDFTGDLDFIQALDNGGTATNVFCYFQVVSNASNFYEISTYNGVLRAYKFVGGAEFIPASITYDANTMKYWGFRHDAPTNTFFWEYSTDGVSFTSFYSETPALPLSPCRFSIGAGNT